MDSDFSSLEDVAADLAEEIRTRSVAGAAAKLTQLDGAQVAAVLRRLSPGFAQDVLAELPDEARERVFAAAPEAVAHQWQRNSFYQPNTVGRLMEPVAGAFPPGQSVGETIQWIRRATDEVVTYIYVVNPDGQLTGVVTMRDLLVNAADRLLEDIMLKDVFALQPAATLEDTMQQVLDRHYPVYPVTDSDGRLMGLVRGHGIFEAQAVEISLQVGSVVGVDKEERVDTPLWQALRMRHPWLQVNLFTAFGTALVVSYFDATIEKIVVLAAFLPVLSCLAGNNGCQTLAITLRGMTLGDLDRHPIRAVIGKEMKLGALNGLLTGIVGGVAMYGFAYAGDEDSPFLLALIMVVAMVGACIVSCLLGTLVPLAVRRFGADPATASGLFVLTITDVCGMGFMLLLATVILL